jgi:predicted small lipoprotein YifL
MRKLTYFLVLLTVLSLAACGQLTPPEITSQPESSTATQPAAANTEPAEEQATIAAVATPAGLPACRVDTSVQAEAAQADLFPKVGPEWSKGSPSAYLTITEYSDFQ